MRITFEAWKAQVREQFVDLTSGAIIHEDDLPDWSYLAAYKDRVAPRTAAKRALRAAEGA